MANDYETVKQRIIASVFNRRNATGDVEESYVCHLKIWEIEGGHDKSRYILLAQTNTGTALIHKSRLNPNGTFSVGKTWNIAELHAVEVVNPLEINITFLRTYVWQSESQSDQNRFLNAVVNLHREVVGRNAALRISGFAVTSDAPQPRQPARTDQSRQITPAQSSSSVPATNMNGRHRDASPVPRRQNRTPANGVRPSSPSGSVNSYRTGSPSLTRPSSPMSVATQNTSATVVPPRPRVPSSAFSARSVDPGPAKLPAIVMPSDSSSAIRPSPLRNRPDFGSNGAQAQSFSASRSSLDVPFQPSSSASTSKSISSITTNPVENLPPSKSVSRSRSNSQARTPSPAPSVASRRSQRSRVVAPSPEPALPSRSQTGYSTPRRDPNARISFFDPTNQALLDRLLFSRTISTQTDTGDETIGEGGEDEGDNVLATLNNIEEMIDGYEWIGDGLPAGIARKTSADQIESRLLDELLLLERANIHSFLESDDRVSTVMKYFDEALSELDAMESTLSSYKIHLNAVGDDILYIQSQNRGLQVQAQNQKALLSELEKLLQTVHVDRETLLTLTQGSLEKQESISDLEQAAAQLYKALLAGKDNDMAATMERLEEYRTHNGQFCKRVLDFLSIMFIAQANLLLGDSNGVEERGSSGIPSLTNHSELEQYIGLYSGLVLYLKEMDESRYAKLCAAYFSAASDLHAKQIKAFLNTIGGRIRRASEEESEQAFSPNPSKDNWTGGLRRAGTVRKERDKSDSGNLPAGEALNTILERILTLVHKEREFITDFLQINSLRFTFADYMGLDHYFRRQAAEYAELSSGTVKLTRGAMDLIFGFLPMELKSFMDNMLSKDQTQIVGMVAGIERTMMDAEQLSNAEFMISVLDKQHQRLKALFERHVEEQIKGVEQTKLNTKKRSGVAHFIRHFPVYVSRVEAQLHAADDLEIRGNVDAAYERIVQAMFDCLRQMAKMDGEQSEDKGQLNYHVILIENMHYFINEVGQSNLHAVNNFRKRAEVIYDENLSAYVKIVMRRAFSKVIEYFEGVERLLKTTAPSEVAKNSSYNRSSLKRVVKEYNAKDIRKNIDALFKRVEKHFSEASDGPAADNAAHRNIAVLAGVWKACESEALRITELFSKRIAQCYADSGVSLEYSVSDIELGFKRHRVGS